MEVIRQSKWMLPHDDLKNVVVDLRFITKYKQSCKIFIIITPDQSPYTVNSVDQFNYVMSMSHCYISEIVAYSKLCDLCYTLLANTILIHTCLIYIVHHYCTIEMNLK
jgi:hypothetical protein